jgi:hypothetical protein
MSKYNLDQTELSLILHSLNPKITSLASRLVEPNNSRDQDDEEDEEALFAELEAEIENDSSAAMREQGLSVLRQE